MKRLLAFLLLSCFALLEPSLSGVGQPSSTDLYTTTFPLTENPISEGGNWLNAGTAGTTSGTCNGQPCYLWANVQTAAGKAFGEQQIDTPAGTSYSDATALLSGSWNRAQSVQATVFTTSGVPSAGSPYWPEVELRLLSTINSSAHTITGYEINFAVDQSGTSPNAYAAVVRWNGVHGDFTYINPGGGNVYGAQYGVKNGDVISASVDASGNILVYKNGNLLSDLSTTDTTFTSGNPGIGFNAETSGAYDPTYGFSSFTGTGGYPAGTGGQVADPVFSPASGTYDTAISVSISDTTSGATICYTTNGTIPAATSGTCTAGSTYTGPITISTAGTVAIKAIASKSDLNNSDVVTGSYTQRLSAMAGGISAVTGQNTGRQSVDGVPGMLAFPASVTSGDQIIVAMHCYSTSTTPIIDPPAKASGSAIVGFFTQDGAVQSTNSYSFAAKVYRAFVLGTGSLTLSFSAANCSGGIVMMDEFQGITAVDSAVINTGTGSVENAGDVTTFSPGMVLMTSAENSAVNFTYTQSDTNIFRDSTGGSDFTGQAQYKITNSAGTYALTAGTGQNWAWWALSVGYK